MCIAHTWKCGTYVMITSPVISVHPRTHMCVHMHVYKHTVHTNTHTYTHKICAPKQASLSRQPTYRVAALASVSGRVWGGQQSSGPERRGPAPPRAPGAGRRAVCGSDTCAPCFCFSAAQRQLRHQSSALSSVCLSIKCAVVPLSP